VISIVVEGIFQNVFHLKIHQNNFYLFMISAHQNYQKILKKNINLTLFHAKYTFETYLNIDKNIMP